MQDSDFGDNNYCDPTLDDHDEGGLSPGAMADKEMYDVPPATEMITK
jgi:hypothetical protein